MARILISEPHRDVQRLLERMLTRMGHEPVLVEVPTPMDLTSADVLIVEPAAPVGVALTQAARIASPSLPVICASVTAAPEELAQLGIAFTATLVKPFTLEQLSTAIDRALLARRGHRNPQHDDRAA